jgi:1-acyl-sn-glycerol-3-phosphate acyltransferase
MLRLQQKLFSTWAAFALFLVGMSHIPLFVFGRSAGYAAPRNWARCMQAGLWLILGSRIEVRGLEHLPPGPVLIAMKHQSPIDTLHPFLWLHRPCFVLKQELLSVPVFGWYCRWLGMIPIAREAGMQSLKDMVKAARGALAEGRSVVIFPEGTRRELGARPDYKPGVAALYRELGVPCVPIALNTGVVWPKEGNDYRPGVITFEVLAPIPAGLSRQGFMQALEGAIEPATDRLVAEERARQASPRPLVAEARVGLA